MTSRALALLVAGLALVWGANWPAMKLGLEAGIAFVLDCHVWSNNSVRVTARNVSASTVDLAAAPLAVQVTKRRVP